jgi:hypothetical protein
MEVIYINAPRTESEVHIRKQPPVTEKPTIKKVTPDRKGKSEWDPCWPCDPDDCKPKCPVW